MILMGWVWNGHCGVRENEKTHRADSCDGRGAPWRPEQKWRRLLGALVPSTCTCWPKASKQRQKGREGRCDGESQTLRQKEKINQRQPVIINEEAAEGGSDSFAALKA